MRIPVSETLLRGASENRLPRDGGRHRPLYEGAPADVFSNVLQMHSSIADRHTERQAYKQTDRQYRHADIEIYGRTDSQTNRWAKIKNSHMNVRSYRQTYVNA